MAARNSSKHKFGTLLIAGGVMTLTLGLLTPGAGAASVTPTLISPDTHPLSLFPSLNYSNPTCGALGFDDEVKVEPIPPQNDPHVINLGDIDGDNDDDTLTISDADEQTFDFDSTARVSAVVVKASDEGWLYNYLPIGTFGDDDLISPSGHGISHLSFCFGGTTPQEPTTTTTEAPTTTTEAPTTTAPPTTAAAVVEDTVVERTTAPPTTAAAQVLGEQLARTGSDMNELLLVAGLALALGGIAVYFGESPAAARRRS